MAQAQQRTIGELEQQLQNAQRLVQLQEATTQAAQKRVSELQEELENNAGVGPSVASLSNDFTEQRPIGKPMQCFCRLPIIMICMLEPGLSIIHLLVSNSHIKIKNTQGLMLLCCSGVQAAL